MLHGRSPGMEFTMALTEQARPPLPPFDADSAARKVRLAEDAWNTRAF